MGSTRGEGSCGANQQGQTPANQQGYGKSINYQGDFFWEITLHIVSQRTIGDIMGYHHDTGSLQNDTGFRKLLMVDEDT